MARCHQFPTAVSVPADLKSLFHRDRFVISTYARCVETCEQGMNVLRNPTVGGEVNLLVHKSPFPPLQNRVPPTRFLFPSPPSHNLITTLISHRLLHLFHQHSTLFLFSPSPHRSDIAMPPQTVEYVGVLRSRRRWRMK